MCFLCLLLVGRRVAVIPNAEKSAERGKQFCNIKRCSGNSGQGAEKFLLLILTCFLSGCLAWLEAHFLSSFTYGWNVFSLLSKHHF